MSDRKVVWLMQDNNYEFVKFVYLDELAAARAIKKHNRDYPLRAPFTVSKWVRP